MYMYSGLAVKKLNVKAVFDSIDPGKKENSW